MYVVHRSWHRLPESQASLLGAVGASQLQSESIFSARSIRITAILSYL